MGVENPEEFRARIRERFETYFTDHAHAINIEKGIFNYTIKECRNRKIIKKWNNPNFVLLYTDRVRTLLNNISKNDIISKIENLSNILSSGQAFTICLLPTFTKAHL